MLLPLFPVFATVLPVLPPVFPVLPGLQSHCCCSLLQAFVVKRLLEYTEQGESDLAYGLLLVLGLLTTELVRSWSLALTWALNYRTGSRLRGAVLNLAFAKILRLRSVRDQSLGQVRVPAASLSLLLWQCLSSTSLPLFHLPAGQHVFQRRPADV